MGDGPILKVLLTSEVMWVQGPITVVPKGTIEVKMTIHEVNNTPLEVHLQVANDITGEEITTEDKIP